VRQDAEDRFADDDKREDVQVGTFLSGPVVITGARGHVGGFLASGLAELPNEVRALGRRDNLVEALRDADAVVHLAGTLQPLNGNTYEQANVDTVRRTMEALAGSSVKRIGFLSYVGANPASRNDYLRTKGEAESLVAGGGRDAVVIRSTFIYGPPDNPGPSTAPFIAHGPKPVSVLGSGAQRYAPVFVGDVAEVLTHATLDPAAPTGTFALAGPDVLTVDEFVQVVNGGDVRERHLHGRLAGVLAHVLPTLTPALVEVMAADSLPDTTLAAEVLGIDLRSIRDVYRYPPVLA
jgi:NADH dehydrogenase